jgi:hypothetical protein
VAYELDYELVGLIVRWAEYWNNDIHRMVDESYAPDCVVETSGHVYRGREELRESELQILKVAPERRMSVRRIITSGDTAVIEVDLFNLGPKLPTTRAVIVTRFRDGMIYSDHSYGPGHDNVMKQAATS